MEPNKNVVEVTSYINNEQFQKISDQASELAEVCRALNRRVCNKVDEFIGCPPSGEGKPSEEPKLSTWCDKIIKEQSDAIQTVKSTLDRLADL